MIPGLAATDRPFDSYHSFCAKAVKLMRVFRFVLAFRTLITSIAYTPLADPIARRVLFSGRVFLERQACIEAN